MRDLKVLLNSEESEVQFGEIYKSQTSLESGEVSDGGLTIVPWGFRLMFRESEKFREMVSSGGTDDELEGDVK